MRRQNGGAPAIYRFMPLDQSPSLLIPDATLPDVDPEFSKIAYLVGSALAIDKGGPLLITKPGSTVEQRVLSEMNRVLGGSGTVYLPGGILALRPGSRPGSRTSATP